MYECIVVQPESPQVLEAEGPLDGAWVFQQDPQGPHSDSWSMSVGAVSDTSESLDPESHGLEPVAGNPVSASRDDAVLSPHTGPRSPTGEVEDG